MSYDDWNPDDFLDFDYGEKKTPQKQNKKASVSDEYKEYLASRKAQKAQKAQEAQASAKVQKVKRTRKKKAHPEHSPEEKAALQQMRKYI